MPSRKPGYQASWQKKRRQEWLEKNGPCRKCGSAQDLEIDHIDPRTKRANVGELWSFSREKREAELAKCQVLCAKCHADKTRSERAVGCGGSGTSYKNGCRCEECRAANTRRQREWKARIIARDQLELPGVRRRMSA